jgi:hypothetical protein
MIKKIFRQIKSLSVLNKTTLSFLLILVIVSAFRQIYGPDVGFHTKTGIWILQNFEFPGKDMFTYTVGTHEYIDLQWLYQITITIVDTLFGEFGLVASNAFLIVVSFILVLFRITRKQNLNEISHWQWILFLAICSVAALFEIRPHTFSWLYLNLVFIVLDEYVERGKNFLVFLPLIMLLWTNTHSIFIIGWIVIGSYILGSIWKERRLWTPITRYGLFSMGISLVNPYFFKGVAYPFHQFQLLQNSNIFKYSISELLSPLSLGMYFYNGAFVLVQPLFWFQIFLAVSIVIFIVRLKRIKLHELLIFLFFLYLGCTAIKNIGFYIFAVLPFTIQGFQRSDLTDKMPKSTRFNQTRIQIILDGIVIMLSIVLIKAIVTDSYYISYGSSFRFGYKYSNTLLPYKASQYLRDNHLEGKILNDIQSGGFLIYMLPQKVSIDGRLEVMGEEFYGKYSFLWNSIRKEKILAEYQPEIVIFAHQYEFLWIHHFKKDTTWRLLYFDELAAIYVKKGYADSIPPFTYTAQLSQYKNIDSTEIDDILRQDYSHVPQIFRFTKRYFPSKELGLSTFCYYDDHFEEAIQIGLHGLLKSTESCPEMYYDLGLYFFENKEFERSAYCFQRYLETNSDSLASQRVELIRSGRIRK